MKNNGFLNAFLAFVCLSLTALASGQERRVDRNLRQLDRQGSRMARQSVYYPETTWTQLSPWVKQYQIRPMQPLQNAANAVTNTANRTANATERAVDEVANATARARFGFNEPSQANSADVWFYDYYNYWPSRYYSTEASAKTYGTAARYYDYDNDGIYESYGSYRDGDHDGRFDEFDRYDFTNSETKYSDDDSPSDANRHSVIGKIDARKTAKVNGVDFLVVRIKNDDKDNNEFVVDLGPADRWTEIKIDQGDSINATGPVERFGDKTVLMAETATIGKKEVKIERPLPSITGTVKEVKRFQVNDEEHSIVVVATDKGNQLVDLGPAETVKVTISPNEKIVVQGVPVRMHDHQVVLAERFGLGGQTYSVTRWK